jgi:hypothetical protein
LPDRNRRDDEKETIQEVTKLFGAPNQVVKLSN